ncbi:hypothetical protein DFJ74DRAFT_668996 [Hyaloraphidium curvatum]|nr:hypothetical protein DFJ74DRAFT_668996 [Hyaloraphidium curvatum]
MPPSPALLLGLSIAFLALALPSPATASPSPLLAARQAPPVCGNAAVYEAARRVGCFRVDTAFPDPDCVCVNATFLETLGTFCPAGSEPIVYWTDLCKPYNSSASASRTATGVSATTRSTSAGVATTAAATTAARTSSETLTVRATSSGPASTASTRTTTTGVPSKAEGAGPGRPLVAALLAGLACLAL